jgi:hypothetical protein
MRTTLRALTGACLVVGAFGIAVAKLPPAPPLTAEQKTEKAAKYKAAADNAKAALAKAEDKAVANYQANMKGKGSANGHAAPGQGVGTSGAEKGLPAQPEKASNAHSPPKK